jgi:phosphate transport system substrate-binding protein
MVSRTISPEEIKKGGWFVPVVKDAVVPTISDKNPALKDLMQRGIRKKAFIDIFMNATLTKWGDVVANKSIKGDLHVYTRSDACGAAESWANYLGGKQENLKGIAVYGDPGLLEAVKRDPLSLGYNNYNYAFDAKTGLPVAGTKVVPVDVNGNSRVDPEEDITTKAKMREAIMKGVYPHPPARPLYFLCRGKAGGLKREFILWVLTDGQKYIDDVGYIQLPKATIDEALAKAK